MALAELAAAVRERRVGARELIALALERIDLLDGDLNAVVRTDPERALAEGERLDDELAGGASAPGPLAGLPLLVKDNEDAAGLRTTYGSLLRADAAPATRDCGAVARLRAAGAIVVGKTNTPEFAMAGFTDNRLFGPTRNPWGREFSPGGSSGGSGAALAAGLAPLATGSDGGGSIRIPAAFCGLVGLKPTNGLLGRDPIPSWIDLSTKGPMTTSVADAALLLEVLRGPVPGDPWTPPTWESRGDARPRRILACDAIARMDVPLAGSVGASFGQALQSLSEVTGLTIERIDSPLPHEVGVEWYSMVGADQLTTLGREVLDRADELTSYVISYLSNAADVSLDDYQRMRRRRFEHVRVMDELLGDDAILATPSMRVEGLSLDGLAAGSSPDAIESGAESAWYNTEPVNIVGLPAISLPAGTSANGIPFGLQLVGPRWADDLLLNVAAEWEAARPWPLTAPGYEPFAV